MGAAPKPAPAATVTAQLPTPVTTESCPICGTVRSDGRFCEDCGYDFVAASHLTVPPLDDPMSAADTVSERIRGRVAVPVSEPEPTLVPKIWTATITADRAYYEAVLAENEDDDADIAAFPVYYPEHSLTLDPASVGRSGVRIGRRSRSRGVTPEIDLAGPPEDTGVSHLHAVLLPQPDGSWCLVDPGSTNGTLLNDGTDPIRPNVAVPLSDGDRIHVGAWTTIIVRTSA
jgi:hypothetical protein